MVEEGVERLMGGYKTTCPTTYVVAWRKQGIIKNGFSTCQRWRKFVLTGADLLALYEFPTRGARAVTFETYLDAKAGFIYPRAFDSKQEARESGLLGPDGGGWMECLRGDADEWLSILLGQCSTSNAPVPTFIAASAMPRTDARYERTYAEPLSPTSDILTLGTRTPAYGICP